jgi:hypothetical protein
MQVKVNTIGVENKFKRLSGKYIKIVADEIQAEATILLSRMSNAQIPVDHGRLKASYVITRTKSNIIRAGSQDTSSGFEPVVYANWIETGRRKLGNKTVTRRGTKGIGAFKKFKKDIIPAIKKAVKSVNINSI